MFSSESGNQKNTLGYYTPQSQKVARKIGFFIQYTKNHKELQKKRSKEFNSGMFFYFQESLVNLAE